MNAASHEQLLEKAFSIVESREFGWRLDKEYFNELGNFIDIIAAMPRNLTVLEVFRAMADYEPSFSEFMHNYDYSWSTAGRAFAPAADLMEQLYSIWVDREAIMAREDNIVDGPGPSEEAWNDAYRKDMFNIIVSDARTYEGRFDASYLGGNRKYGKDVDPVSMVALFNLEEIWWSEFQDTFDDEANSKMHAGVMVEGIDSDFNPHWFIWQGSITEATRGLRS